MSEFSIPCEVFARLATVLTGFVDDRDCEWFNSIRLEDGIAIACNRRIMSIENVGKFKGVMHVTADTALIAQCRTEAPYGSILIIDKNDLLPYATAKTSFGYVHPGNVCHISTQPNDLDKWRSIVERCAEPVATHYGAMFWEAALIAQLAASSPTGNVIFEERQNIEGRPTIIRDTQDPDWLGIFQPWPLGGKRYVPAKLPDWVR